jgi:hypothetical protein
MRQHLPICRTQLSATNPTAMSVCVEFCGSDCSQDKPVAALCKHTCLVGCRCAA